MEKRDNLKLRKVCANDIAAVFSMEQRAYEDGWSSDIMHTLLETQHYYGQILERVTDSDRVVCGYCFFSVIFDECHLLNLCIDPDQQGQGLGRYLLDIIVSKAASQGAKQVFLEVRESNLAAIGLYFSSGFTELGRRKGYYPTKTQGREDALVLVKNLEGKN
ncbi:ribosomal-protein-alanine N-acetyltransferase [Piscirickettsia litoralis]|uniref:Ribosomal-protein-alanine N-acetyltransferase n=2 Tax=Piscirickettsia litoralis TaxID=1891921 RepID=A0ABX3A347_9GAMM|nr:ribosomal-protein-alanine N-acetyltransferase [Piscirickettsia litoralis]